MRYCKKCDALINIDDPNVINKTSIITKKGSSSSGCSMKRFWYCDENCAPKEGENLPPHTAGMIVGEVISIEPK
jgi:hypothetical protein